MVTQTNESGWHPDSFANRMAERGRKQMEEEAARERVRDAAFDLLEAARLTVEHHDNAWAYSPAVVAAKRAIAKAKGR